MSLRVPWMDKYGVILQTSSIGATRAFGSGSGIGIGANNKFALPLINHPDINAGLNIVDQRKALGISQRSVATGHCEYLQGTKNPTTTLEFDGNAYNLAPFLWLLFQKGTTEGTGTSKFTKIFDPPTATEGAECEVWANVLRKMEEGSSAHSTRGTGFIVKSITLSSDGFSPLRASVEMIGSDVSYIYNATSALLNFNANCGVVWGGASGVTTILGASPVQLEGFSITITNNAIPRNYGQQTVQKFITGDYTVDGSITVFWGDTHFGQETEITKWINGTDQLLNIYWGSVGGNTTAGDISIKTNIRYTGATVNSNDEIAIELPFIGVYDGTNDAIEITLVDGYDCGIA